MRPQPPLRRLAHEAAMRDLGAAWAAIKAGGAAEAVRILAPLIAREPDFAPPHELMAYVHQMVGDLDAAEGEIRKAIACDKRVPAFRAALGEILWLKGETKAAESAFRAALERDRRDPRAAEGLAGLLLEQDRAGEALTVLRPALPGAPFPLRRLQVRALRMLRRPEEALTVLDDRSGAPTGETEALVAAVQEEMGRTDEAETAVRRALAADDRDADAWARLARLLQARGEVAEAERACRQALARAPADQGAHTALAELVWMRTADAPAALDALERALAQTRSLSLFLLKVRLMAQLGLTDAAYDALAAASAADPASLPLRLAAASGAAAAGRLADMLVQARAAEATRPDDFAVKRIVADALVRTGDFAAALMVLDPLLAARPADQQAITLRALAWRGIGDPRYGEVYDYAHLVRPYTIEPPKGWCDLEGFLADLARTLRPLHRFDTHPLGQSLRGGTQTSHNLVLSADPVIRAFFETVAAPIRAYVAEAGPDALRARRGSGHRIEAAWSVKLKPNGFHVSHMHPDGLVSSAFYVEVPEVVDQPDRPGWLQFGDPGTAMTTPMGPDHFVRPQPGTLVLFPSYMLHGTRPFPGPAERLTVAFDVVAAGR